VSAQIVAAIDAELRKKGFKPVETAGDLEVHLQTDVGVAEKMFHGFPPRP